MKILLVLVCYFLIAKCALINYRGANGRRNLLSTTKRNKKSLDVASTSEVDGGCSMVDGSSSSSLFPIKRKRCPSNDDAIVGGVRQKIKSQVPNRSDLQIQFAKRACEICRRSNACKRRNRCEHCHQICQTVKADEPAITSTQPQDSVVKLSQQQQQNFNMLPLEQLTPDDNIVLTSRLKEETEEEYSRYYPLGSFKPGSTMETILKMMNVENTRNIKEVLVLAKMAHQDYIKLPKGVNNDVFAQLLDRELDIAKQHKMEKQGIEDLTPEEINDVVNHALRGAKSELEGVTEESMITHFDNVIPAENPTTPKPTKFEPRNNQHLVGKELVPDNETVACGEDKNDIFSVIPPKPPALPHPLIPLDPYHKEPASFEEISDDEYTDTRAHNPAVIQDSLKHAEDENTTNIPPLVDDAFEEDKSRTHKKHKPKSYIPHGAYPNYYREAEEVTERDQETLGNTEDNADIIPPLEMSHEPGKENTSPRIIELESDEASERDDKSRTHKKKLKPKIYAHYRPYPNYYKEAEEVTERDPETLANAEKDQDALGNAKDQDVLGNAKDQDALGNAEGDKDLSSIHAIVPQKQPPKVLNQFSHLGTPLPSKDEEARVKDEEPRVEDEKPRVEDEEPSLEDKEPRVENEPRMEDESRMGDEEPSEAETEEVVFPKGTPQVAAGEPLSKDLSTAKKILDIVDRIVEEPKGDEDVAAQATDTFSPEREAEDALEGAKEIVDVFNDESLPDVADPGITQAEKTLDGVKDIIGDFMKPASGSDVREKVGDIEKDIFNIARANIDPEPNQGTLGQIGFTDITPIEADVDPGKNKDNVQPSDNQETLGQTKEVDSGEHQGILDPTEEDVQLGERQGGVMDRTPSEPQRFPTKTKIATPTLTQAEPASKASAAHYVPNITAITLAPPLDSKSLTEEDGRNETDNNIPLFVSEVLPNEITTIQPYEKGHLGKLVPVKKDKKHYTFFGDGITLPLRMTHNKDGSVVLKMDLEKLCNCRNKTCLVKQSSIENHSEESQEDIKPQNANNGRSAESREAENLPLKVDPLVLFDNVPLGMASPFNADTENQEGARAESREAENLALNAADAPQLFEDAPPGMIVPFKGNVGGQESRSFESRMAENLPLNAADAPQLFEDAPSAMIVPFKTNSGGQESRSFESRMAENLPLNAADAPLKAADAPQLFEDAPPGMIVPFKTTSGGQESKSVESREDENLPLNAAVAPLNSADAPLNAADAPQLFEDAPSGMVVPFKTETGGQESRSSESHETENLPPNAANAPGLFENAPPGMGTPFKESTKNQMIEESEKVKRSLNLKKLVRRLRRKREIRNSKTNNLIKGDKIKKTSKTGNYSNIDNQQFVTNFINKRSKHRMDSLSKKGKYRKKLTKELKADTGTVIGNRIDLLNTLLSWMRILNKK